MSNATTSERGLCPAPFLQASAFGKSGGYIDGRFCAELLPGAPECCLPCPSSQWIYSDSFNTISSAAAWLNVAGFILLVFLLLSYIVLPAEKTNKHYLNICLIISCVLINLGFIVPLAADSDQCYDKITPNDIHSDNACAWSGAFILSGGLAAAFWVCLRALSMFLQIVWGIEPGRKSFYLYQFLGWVIPAALLTASLTVTGASYRFGHACHVNHDYSMADFWGWILGVAGLTIIIQISTIAYCLKVYLANLFANDEEDPEEDIPDLTPVSFNEKAGMSLASPTPSQSEPVARKVTAGEIYREVKTVLYVQWRILLLTMCMLIEVIFFSITFVYLDTSTAAVQKNSAKAQDWVICLITSGGDKNKCLSKTKSWMVSLSTIAAVLIMLSLIAISVFGLLFRASIITGWREWIAQHITHRNTFAVSGNPHAPEIRHLGPTSPSDSQGSQAPLAPGSSSNYYDVNSQRQQRPAENPGQGRYWHPNPNVQVAQREGIMRTLRAARSRAQGSSPRVVASPHPGSMPSSSSYYAAPYGAVVPPAQGSNAYPQTPTTRHELPQSTNETISPGSTKMYE